MNVKEFFAEAVSDLRVPENTKVYQDRFEIVNRAVGAVVHHFYHLMAGFYHTSDTVTVTGNAIDLSAVAIMPGIFEKGTTIVGPDGVFSPTSVTKYHILTGPLFEDKGYRVFTKVGGAILINTDNGSVTIFYYRQPEEVEDDDDDLDIPSGATIDLALSKAKIIIQERLRQDPNINRAEIKDQISRLGEQYNHSLQQDQLEDKVQAFI